MLITLLAAVAPAGEPWKRHTIDNTSHGADGVRIADVNGDGLADIATGWEEGGVIRVYLHPGARRCRQTWPSVTVGRVKSPEDAVFVDLDADGAVDVVSSCEGRNRTMYVHWAPRKKSAYLDPSAWKTEPIPCTQKKQMWMFATPAQIDGRDGLDLFVGSKGKAATVGWLRSPKDPRRLNKWRYHSLYKASWIMSLIAHDMDGDGDQDVLVSDRKGARRGVLWLENPSWKEHRIGGAGQEVMFLSLADLDQDGRTDIVAATRNSKLLLFRSRLELVAPGKQQKNTNPKTPLNNKPSNWQEIASPNPYGQPNGKAVAAADINLDGRIDLIHDANTGGDRSSPGVSWLAYGDSPWSASWTANNISGRQGVKFDLLQPLDVDRDGDMDVITCEERDNLGVVWYENPTK